MNIKIADTGFTKVYGKYCSSWEVNSRNQFKNQSFHLSIQESKRECSKSNKCIAIQGISDIYGNLECEQNSIGCELCAKIYDHPSDPDAFILQKGKFYCKQSEVVYLKQLQ